MAMAGTAGCGGMGDYRSGAGDDDDGSPSADGDSDVDADGDSDSDSDLEGPPEGNGGAGGVGILTAGAWDDNRNYDHYLAYLSSPAGQIAGAPPFTMQELDESYEVFGQPRSGRTNLEVALVIDTTGSMGDEISYLRDEYLAITETISQAFPNATQRWALVAYKDEGDVYVTRSFDFSSDAQEFRARLADEPASGGGDFPEAPEQALAAMNDLSWGNAANTARVAFWVADAPHHADDAGAFADAVCGARGHAIHLYPVASSGTDGLAELAMRQAAQMTGGRYLFLTDDSGVGGSHAEPTIPCYYVTRLDKALIRMIEIEMTGEYREPAPDEVLRTGGDPQNGACTLSGGEVVEAY
jgi:hypothetical protein